MAAKKVWTTFILEPITFSTWKGNSFRQYFTVFFCIYNRLKCQISNNQTWHIHFISTSIIFVSKPGIESVRGKLFAHKMALQDQQDQGQLIAIQFQPPCLHPLTHCGGPAGPQLGVMNRRMDVRGREGGA